MREINLTFANFGNRVIPIGTAGENLAMQVKIDCSAPLAEHPGAHAALTVNPPSGGEYTGETWTDGTDVYWKVQDSDLLVPGRGNVVLSIIDNLGMILETAAAIIVIQDNNESGALPKWLDDLIAKALYLDSIAEPAAAGAVAAKLLAEAAATNAAASATNAAASAADAAQYTAAAIATWLEAHPEATTTVQDGAISYAKLDTNLKGHADAIAPTETSTTSSRAYAVGNRFFLGGVLYEATVAIASGGTITTSGEGVNVKTVPYISNDVSELKSAVTRLENGQYVRNITFESGLYSGTPVVGEQVNLTPTANNAWERCKTSVKAGDIISFFGSGTTNTKLYTITDASGIVLQVATVGTPPQNPWNIEIVSDGFVYMSAQKSAEHFLNVIVLNGYDAILDKAESYADEVGNSANTYTDTEILEVKNTMDETRYVESATFESGLYSGTPVVGEQVNLTPTANDAWRRCKTAFNAGDTITLWGSGSTNTKLYTITDASGVVLQVATVGTPASPVTYNASVSGFVYMSTQKTVNYYLNHAYKNGFNALEQAMEAYSDANLAEAKAYADSLVDKAVYPLNFLHDPSNIPVQENGSQYNISNVNTFYALYDQLMTNNSDYITKVDCSDADSVLGITRPAYLEGIPIYLYKFTPKIVYTQSSEKRRIKMMILTGVHSNEKWNMYNVYKLLEYICNNWNTDRDALAIRTFIEIWVIPIVNPWGFIHYGESEYPNAGRCNYNGVNLNRNAPSSDWTLEGAGTSNYSGPSAGSEYETKIWTYYHDLLQPDVFIDQHTPGMPESGIFGLAETHLAKTYLANTCNVIAREISNNMLRIDSNVPQNPNVALFDSASDRNHGGTSEYAGEHGTSYSFLFEMAINSLWEDGVLTGSTVTGGTEGLMKQEQMQNIFLAWTYLLECAATDVMH